MQVEKKYKAEIADLENILEEERDNFSQQRDALLVSHSRERNSWQRKQDIMKQDLEEEIASCTQARLEVSSPPVLIIRLRMGYLLVLD